MGDVHYPTIHYAAIQGDAGALLALLDCRCEMDVVDGTGSTPLMCAAAYGRSDCVELLIRRGSDVHKRSESGHTAAHCAAQGGHVQVLLALLDAGCEVDTCSEMGTTPLMSAAANGRTPCLEMLIQRGADVCKRSRTGRTAAHYAAQRGHLGALQVLFAAKGAEVTSPHERLSVADCAASSSRVNALLYALACGCRLKCPRDADQAVRGLCSAVHGL